MRSKDSNFVNGIARISESLFLCEAKFSFIFYNFHTGSDQAMPAAKLSSVFVKCA